LATVSTAFSQAFTVTLEAPKVQQSYLTANPSGFGATNVFTEIFDELPAGFKQTLTPFAGNSAIGSCDKLLIRPADQFGGAGGTGRYLTVNRNINAADVATTLTFTSPQRYFGVWWSAGDSTNTLSFYSGSTLLETFATSDIVNFINKQANKSSYFGNPNSGQNKGESYAYLNFFADLSNTGLTFDRVVFSNIGGTGFEQDNHTIASQYTDDLLLKIDGESG
jgi:hypothetical protein